MNARQVAAIGEQLTVRDHAVLTSLERFRLLGTRHLQRLHFTSHASSLAAARACNRALLRLRDEVGVIASLQRRVGGVRRGSAGYVWQLTATGERYLRASRGQARRRRYVEPSGVFVAHTLAVAEVAVGLLEADRDLDGFTVEELRTEPGNWRQYLGSAGETRWLKPDLHLISSLTDAEGEYEEHTFLEIDLGTEHLPRIQAKCRTYAAYAQTGAYQARHGLFPAVVWLSSDPARRAALSVAVATTLGLPDEVFHVTSPEAYLAAIHHNSADRRDTDEQKGGTT